MNPVRSLNLAAKDEGVAAISNLPIAIDWLAVAYPPIINNIPTFTTPVPPQPPPGYPPTTLPPTRLPQTQTGPAPISNSQAMAALVRYIQPYGIREVLAPCFAIQGRFVLGRTLGNLFVPPELGLPQIANEHCSDSRFVLDLRFGSIVEVRQYPIAKVLLCIAYTSVNTEFLTLLPIPNTRVEISYGRDPSEPDVTPGLGVVFDDENRQKDPLTSWTDFCNKYPLVFPTGPLTASVTCQPGSTTPTFKKEGILISLQDPYALSMSSAAQAARASGPQARRIAPKRLLPRPAP